jgi:hypothetical protein
MRGVSQRLGLALGFVIVSACALACGANGNYTRSAYGTEGGYSMGHVYAKPPTPLVARKITRPLYIVLDEARVRDGWRISTPTCQVDSDDCEKFVLYDMHLFVKRDLQRLLSNYFARVEVVPAGTVIRGPHVIADVKIDDIRLRNVQRGALLHTFIDMTWGIAMRRNEDKDYAFSYATTSSSNDTYATFEAGLVQLVENSLGAMSEKWTQSGSLERFYE